VKTAIDKPAWFRGIDAPQMDVSGLPDERRRFPAQVARRSTNQGLERRKKRKYPILLAFVAQAAVDQLDEVVALFDQAVSARESRAKPRTEEALAERAKKGEARQLLMDVILPVLADPPVPDELVGGRLRDQIGMQRLRRSPPAPVLAHISPGHSDNVNFFGVINVDVEAELAKLGGGGGGARSGPPSWTYRPRLPRCRCRDLAWSSGAVRPSAARCWRAEWRSWWSVQPCLCGLGGGGLLEQVLGAGRTAGGGRSPGRRPPRQRLANRTKARAGRRGTPALRCDRAAAGAGGGRCRWPSGRTRSRGPWR
jgi:hypothetical protein